ncbi:MAG TPA: TetR family transcriptional regulator [Acidimicrobiales bacterium]|jgi:AcrR family transcriptional regulator|nr:TetR family transcriptional regulator [Acidimicrobiales bacterium]
MRTRQRLLDCTAELVEEVPYRELTSALVTQRLGLSPPAFYRYFADITDAILELTARMGETVSGIAASVREADWRADADGAAAALVDATGAFWTRHRALYRITDLLAEEGDARFATVKQRTFAPLNEEMTEILRAGVSDDRDPVAAAGVLVATLIHTTAREPGFAAAGIATHALRRELARLVAQAIDSCSSV